jgi:hypothetical protein
MERSRNLQRMKRTWFKALLGSFVALSGCGDSGAAGGAPTGGAGGSGGTEEQGGAGGSGGAGATGGNSATGGCGGAGAAGGEGGSGGSETCISLSTGDVHFLFPAVYELDPEDFGGANPDTIRLELFPAAGQPLSGVQDLAANGNDNYGTCTSCLVAGEDLVGTAPARYYFAESGTIDLGPIAADGIVGAPITSGFVDNAKLVEVTVNLDTFVSTKVEGGACLVVSGPITMLPTPKGWTCDPSTYADKQICHCDCGVEDLDCLDPELPPLNC